MLAALERAGRGSERGLRPGLSVWPKHAASEQARTPCAHMRCTMLAALERAGGEGAGIPSMAERVVEACGMFQRLRTHRSPLPPHCFCAAHPSGLVEDVLMHTHTCMRHPRPSKPLRSASSTWSTRSLRA
eukprot:352988-Chlamydomonas_euryale.AAC.1